MILVNTRACIVWIIKPFYFPAREKRILLITNLIIRQVNNSFILLWKYFSSEIRSFEVCIKSQSWESFHLLRLFKVIFFRIIASYNVKKLYSIRVTSITISRSLARISSGCLYLHPFNESIVTDKRRKTRLIIAIRWGRFIISIEE